MCGCGCVGVWVKVVCVGGCVVVNGWWLVGVGFNGCVEPDEKGSGWVGWGMSG